MKNIENIIVILLACIVILINGQYVAEDKGGLMRYIPTYDKAGNKMGAHWWHPIYKLDQTPPPWQPWQKTSQTEFTDNRFNPEGLGIENFAHDALQTWPTPIVIGKPGHEEYPGKKYDLQGPAAGELIKPHQDVVGQAPAGQTPYPNYNLRMAAMPMHEDYMRIDPKLAQKTLDQSVPSAPPPKGTSSMGDKPDDKVNSAGNPLNAPSKMPLPSDFLEVGFYPRAPVHLASTIIARGQPVPTADLNGATHTVVHQALQGVNVGAAENSYASTQPSFATNQLAYRLQAVARHRSQIGAAADAQTRILQHPNETYGGGNVPYHSLHPPVIGYQRAPAHYITTTSASRPGDGNYGRNNGSLQFYNSNNWNGNKIPDKNIQKIVDNELKDLIEKFGLGILKDRGKNMFLSKLVGTMDDFYPHQGWTRESLRPYLQNAILSREEKTRAKSIQRQNTQTTMNTNSNNTKIINTSNITNNNNDGEWPTKPTKP